MVVAYHYFLAKELTKKTGLKWETEYKFCPDRRWRIDLACPEIKLAVEQEGGAWTYGRHNRSRGFLKDIEKYNALTLQGWYLLRFPPNQMQDGTAHKTIFKFLEGQVLLNIEDPSKAL